MHTKNFFQDNSLQFRFRSIYNYIQRTKDVLVVAYFHIYASYTPRSLQLMVGTRAVTDVPCWFVLVRVEFNQDTYPLFVDSSLHNVGLLVNLRYNILIRSCCIDRKEYKIQYFDRKRFPV